jgi:hypothetical protein
MLLIEAWYICFTHKKRGDVIWFGRLFLKGIKEHRDDGLAWHVHEGGHGQNRMHKHLFMPLYQSFPPRW